MKKMATNFQLQREPISDLSRKLWEWELQQKCHQLNKIELEALVKLGWTCHLAL